MTNIYIRMGFILIFSILLLAACGGNEETNPENNTDMETEPDSEEHTEDDTGTESDSEDKNHEDMEMDEEAGEHSEENMHDHMSSSGEVPEGLAEAEDPAYDVGDEVIIEVEHSEGGEEMMKGAEAAITGAFDTTAYSVSFTPTNGRDPVEDHKWVIHEELEEPDEAPLEPGTEVTLDASHMEGMEGATAEIDSAEETTVYMVDFTTTSGGEKVENHKWVIEEELSPVE
ncbi:YdhK family protein [Alteribacillus sp. YIM 98480]|uniref:YdhK family protein n=1 Tax=Alteribacillus sp. YIM 98480 TaxID=2606599 RepID=UPI00131C1E34|nr:YdhK family protein [Alteribacillus sp. YIM 98480]